MSNAVQRAKGHSLDVAFRDEGRRVGSYSRKGGCWCRPQERLRMGLEYEYENGNCDYILGV